MRGLFFLLDWIATPMYILLGVMIIWFFYRLLQARGEMSATYFELERDLAGRRQSNAITFMILAVQFCVLLFGVQVRAVPFLEAERDLDDMNIVSVGATQDIAFDTDTPAPLGEGGLNIQVGTPLGDNPDIIVLTPTPTPTPVGTIVPGAPPVQGCQDDRALLEVPANGQRVFQPLIVRGIASADNFTEASIEISGPQTNGQFVVVNRVNSPVREMSDFSQFLPAPYEPGAYQFRLMVFDITDSVIAACQVTIYISDPPTIGTPTPNA